VCFCVFVCVCVCVCVCVYVCVCVCVVCFYVSSIIIAYLESRKRENSYHSNKFGQFDTTHFKVHYAIIGMTLGSAGMH